MFYPIQVIYEDNHLIAVNKPAGMLVHEDHTGDPTLEEQVKLYIKHRYGKPGDVYLGVLHRIDRPVSGVVVFARTSKAASRMSDLFRKREIKKKYVAVVRERPSNLEDTLVHYIHKDKDRNMVRAYNKEKAGAKKAVLDYRFLGQINKESILHVNLHTGRPHQVRLQLRKIGCVINGDIKYGSIVNTQNRSVMLHSRTMEFIHPVKKEPVSITAEVPETVDWRDVEELLIQEKL